jgi:hypothetical protein
MCAKLWGIVDVRAGTRSEWSRRHDHGQGSWAIDGLAGVLRDYGSGGVGFTTASPAWTNARFCMLCL